jgi:hypothetical protein
MKLLNRFQLNERIRENYNKDFWSQMTAEERAWAMKFENFEYQMERGKPEDALTLATELNPALSESCKQLIVCEAYNKERTNPNLAARKDKYENKQKKGLRKPKSNMYDRYDHKKDNGTTLDDDGVETERGIATNPEENLVEAINESQLKKCSLERLVEDYKLSKIAKAELLARTQKMTYEAMTYTFHGTQYMNLNYILKGANGQLYVQDQHDRIQSMQLYLKRQTEDSFATHAEVWYPGRVGEAWVFQPGPKSNIEGKAVKYEVS